MGSFHGILEDKQAMLQWGLIFVGIVVLIQMKFILFAAALPLLAYWHFSQQHTEADVKGAHDEREDSVDLPDDDEIDQGEDNGEDERLSDAVFSGGDSKDPDIYDDSFWSDRPAAGRGSGGRSGVIDRDETPLPGTRGGGGGGGASDDFSFDSFGAGGGAVEGVDDIDLMGGLGSCSGFSNRGSRGGAGREKGKGGKGKGGKEDKGPREANPKQVFVTGVGELSEDDIRDFFTDVGEVDRVKVLKELDGRPKGVCFVTFREEAEAQKALSLHNTAFEGRTLTVRLAHAGNKGEKGQKGSKGTGRDDSDRHGGFDHAPDLGGSERFGILGGDSDRTNRPKGGGKKGGGKRQNRNDIDEILEEALEGFSGPLKASDFDFAAKLILAELRTRDRIDNTERFQEALDMVFKCTASKDRDAVRKWPAYIFKLLQKFDMDLWEKLQDRHRKTNKDH